MTDAPIVSLSYERGVRSGNSKDWTVLDALEAAIARLSDESDPIRHATRCVLVFANVDDEGDGVTGILTATQNGYETLGLLQDAIGAVAGD